MHKRTPLFFDLLLFVIILIISSPITSAQEISLPNCNNVKEIEFDISQIIDFDNRFLFEDATDTLESLYCFAKRTGNKELEAISLFKFAHEYYEIFYNTENFITTLSYIDASIELSNKHNLYTPLFWAKELQTTIFTSNRMYDQASVFAEQLIELAKKKNDPKRLAESYMILGRLRRDQKRFTEADSILNLALTYQENPKSSNRTLAYTYLHLSNLKRMEKKYFESIEYAKKGLEYAKKRSNPKSGVLTYLAMELTLNYIETGEYEAANNSIQLYSHNIRHTKWIEVQEHLINGFIYEKEGQLDKALSEYKVAKNLSTKAKTNVLSLQITDALMSVYQKNGILSPKVLEIFKEMSHAYSEIAEQSGHGNLFKDTYFKLENEKKNSKLLKSNLKNSQQLLILFISIIVSMTIIGILIYRQTKLKRAYYLDVKQFNVQLKKNNLDLKNSYEEIASHKDKLSLELKQQLLFLANQNNMIDSLKNYIMSNDEIDKRSKHRVSSIMNLERNNEIIDNINIKFLELNGNLLNKLSSDFPKLTSNDLKLCIYLSMNLSSKEIAQIQYKSPDSIKVARSRLRKKLNIKDQSLQLSAFINGYT